MSPGISPAYCLSKVSKLWHREGKCKQSLVEDTKLEEEERRLGRGEVKETRAVKESRAGRTVGRYREDHWTSAEWCP